MASKQRCESICEAFKAASWLKGGSVNETPSLNDTINNFEKHLMSKCGCTSANSDRLIIAVAYYNKYLCYNSNYKVKIGYELNNKIEEKFDYRIFTNLVNEKMEIAMLKPLKACICKLWDIFIISKSDLPSAKLCKDLMITDIIKTSFFIFDCFKESDYQLYAAKLLLVMGKDKNLTDDGLSDSVFGYHCLIQLYLDYNLVENAKECLKKADLLLEKANKNGLEYGLIRLNEFYIDIVSNRISEGVKKLKIFLTSPVLKPAKISRKYMKVYALLLLTSLPAEYSPFQHYEEFLESISIIRQCLALWHGNLFNLDSTKQPPDTQFGCPNEDYLRFMVYSLGFKFFTSLMAFCLNTGMHGDIERYYNVLFTISRENCFLYWSIKLVKSAALLEASLMKTESALVKLEEAVVAFRQVDKAKNMENNLTSGDKISNGVESEDIKKNGIPAYLNGVDLNCDSPKKCYHTKEMTIREIDLALKKNVPQNDNMTDGGYLPLKTLLKLFAEKKYPLNLLYIEILANLYWLRKKIDAESINILKDLLNSTSTHVGCSLEKICHKFNTSYSKLSVDSLPDIVHFKLDLIKVIHASLPCDKKFAFLYTNLNTFVAKNVKTYLNYNDSSCFLRLIHALTIMKLKDFYRNAPNDAYDGLKMEEKVVSTSIFPVTPEKKVPKKNLRAPSRTNNYKMTELKGYVKGLRNAPQSDKRGNKVQMRSLDLDIDYEGSIESTIRSTKSPDSQRRRRRSSIKMINRSLSSKTCKTLKRPQRQQRINDEQEENFSASPEMIDLIELIDDLDSFYLSSYAPLCSWLNKTEFNANVFRRHLLDLLYFMGNRPPLDLYNSIKYALFELSSKLEDKNGNSSYVAVNHLIDSVNNITRYRSIITSHRRKRIQLNRILPSEFFYFKVDKNKAEETDLLNSLLQNVPQSWRLLQIQTVVSDNDKMPDLLLSRYQNGAKPIVLRIKCNTGKFTRHFTEELKEILELTDITIKKRDKTTFWKTREALDNRLLSLLSSVSSTWLGPFQGFFLGQTCDDLLNDFTRRVHHEITHTFQSSFCTNFNLIQVLAESLFLIEEEEFKKGMCYLFPESPTKDIYKCYQSCLDLAKSYYNFKNRDEVLASIDYEPVGLIVGKGLTSFPFESLSLCKLARQQFFRIPSLRFLATQLKFFQTESFSQDLNNLNPDSVFYLLNPDNNLARTESRFKDKFLTKKSWLGYISSSPDPETLKSSLMSKDIYLYFGHGAGSSHFRPCNGIDCLDLKSIGLILGCSSGHLHDENIAGEPIGTPYRYLMCGSPSFLGLLWDVTDGDIDRYAEKLLSNIIPNWDNSTSHIEKSLLTSLGASRIACRLKSSTGAAPVLYGLPVYFTSNKK